MAIRVFFVPGLATNAQRKQGYQYGDKVGGTFQAVGKDGLGISIIPRSQFYGHQNGIYPEPDLDNTVRAIEPFFPL
jgi:hypothetical protein